MTVLLLELDPDGRPTKLEMATGDGLLSLHPEPAPAALHGNVVRATGVEHLTLPWSADHILVAAGSPVTAAAAASLLAGRIGVGEGHSVPAVMIETGLTVRRATWRVLRFSERRWRLLAADGSADIAIEVDDTGVPMFEHEAVWPLELEPAG